ncbi:hypothetical protein KR067_012010 [Drosophila pandora]|nr:hypothetical protein KR067_012010 [Drosophila pandora]
MPNMRGKQSPSTPHQPRPAIKTASEEGESLSGTEESPKKCGSPQRVVTPLCLPSKGEGDGRATLEERAACGALVKPESPFGSMGFGTLAYGSQGPKQETGLVKFGPYRRRGFRPVPYGPVPSDRDAQPQGGSEKNVLVNNNRHSWLVSKNSDNDKEILKIKEYRISNQGSSKPRRTSTNRKVPSGSIQHDDYEELLATQMNSMHLHEEFWGLGTEPNGSPPLIFAAGTTIPEKLGLRPGDDPEKLKEVFHRVYEFLNPEVALWQRALQVVETLIAENDTVASDKKLEGGLLLRVSKRPAYSVLFRLEYNPAAKTELSLVETKASIENKIRSLHSSLETDHDDKKSERFFLPPVSSGNGSVPEVELPGCGPLEDTNTSDSETPKDDMRKEDFIFEQNIRH